MTAADYGPAETDVSRMSLMERIALLPDAEREQVLAEMTDQDLVDQRLWLRPSQLEVLDDETPTVVYAAGRGAGKTRVGAAWTIERARMPGTRIHLVGRTVGDVRDVMVTGESGIVAVSAPDFRPTYVPSQRKVVWPNGSTAATYSAESPDQLRGPQAEYAWCDELGAWRPRPDDSGATAWDHVLIGTRLGVRPQVLVTTTPRRTKVVRDLLGRAVSGDLNTSVHGGSTFENRANLSSEYLSHVHAMYAGTALEQQELYGVLVDEVAGALWREMDVVPGVVDRPLHELVTVIGVDPSTTSTGDATGVVTIRGEVDRPMSQRRAWVVRDDTAEGAGPDQWAARIVEVWREETERSGRPAIVVAERNQGGEMVARMILQTPGGERIPVETVHARVSKAARAEPVVMAYRQRRVQHAPAANGPGWHGLEELEEQMTTWEPQVSGWSPDRVDALVHALRAVLYDDQPIRRHGSLSAPLLEGSIRVQGFQRDDRARASLWTPFRRGREKI